MEVKVRLVNLGNDKLATVKAINYSTGLGLKESKEFIDAFHPPKNMVVQTLDVVDFDILVDCLSKCNYDS